MPVGIAGDSAVTIGGLPAADLSVIEMRVMSNLLQQYLSAGQSLDELNTMRGDQAFELGIATPLPGANM